MNVLGFHFDYLYAYVLLYVIEKRLKEDLELEQDIDCATMATEIEAALFETFGREVNNKYKTKYRALSFNLKDSKNNVLYKYVEGHNTQI